MKHLWYPIVLLASTVSSADNVETLAERSQSQARAIVARAVDAMGGEQALHSIEAVRLQLDGEIWPRLQMPTAAPPFTPGTQQETVLVDLKNNRLALELRTTGAGFEGHNTLVLQGGEGKNYDHRARTVTPIPAAQSSQQQVVQYYRRLPHLLLQQALARETSLRYLGEDIFDGRKHNVVTFAMADAQQVALYVDDATALVSKYELVFTDPLLGEDVSEVVFGNYTRDGKFPMPQQWSWYQVGERMADFKMRAEINPKLAANDFAVTAKDYVTVEAVSQNFEPSIEKLSEGVFVMHNVAGQNQNTLAVEFKDYIIAVEAPGSSAGSDAVIARIKETIPGKPIKYLAMTHHHGDHIGGLRSYVAEGATIVTTPGNRALVEAMAKAPQLDRLAANPRQPEFLFIEKRKRLLTDGKQTLELINIGPHPHAWDMVIAYLPQQRVVFQGDMFFVPNNNAPQGPAQASTAAFARRLKEAKLEVEKIASVHGRTATMAELEAATRDAT
jgi:glyoxylase-like metal-dependent hydrolase (beta-lactamase superfamily II)